MHKIIDNSERALQMSPKQLQRIVKCCHKIKKHLNDIKDANDNEFFKNVIESCEIWCNLIIIEIVGKNKNE